jgi:Gpi18-like mannosyltransferase
MYAWSKGHYEKAAVLWTLATLTRSNGILYCGFYLYDIFFRRKTHFSFTVIVCQNCLVSMSTDMFVASAQRIPLYAIDIG